MIEMVAADIKTNNQTITWDEVISMSPKCCPEPFSLW
jgi:hypothetical protein